MFCAKTYKCAKVSQASLPFVIPGGNLITHMLQPGDNKHINEGQLNMHYKRKELYWTNIICKEIDPEL